jgi:alanine dehydrogenase
MLIGIPKEKHRDEHRVGLTPGAVGLLVRRGHTVLVESQAGDEAHFTDHDFQKRGGAIVYNREEVFRRAEMVCRVGMLAPDEVELLRPGQVVCAFHHLAVARRELVSQLMELEATLVGYELVRDAEGRLGALWPMSEMAGHMAVQVAAHYLQNEAGGRGILLANVAGVAPPTVLILGAGTAGRTAARHALDAGAHVILVDTDLEKLRQANHSLAGQAVTVVTAHDRLTRFTSFADVVIGAVLVPGSRAPYLVTEEMVRKMKPGSIIVDLSIDQGGCVETSRPTSPQDPVFVRHGVIHYCVPNMTANIARTASRSLANAVLPYVTQLAGQGLEQALAGSAGLAAGVYLYRGHVVNEATGETLGLPVDPLAELLAAGRQP